MAHSGAVVVTGASSGIGAATATALAACGFTVFGGVRDAPAAVALAGLEVRPLRLDVTAPDQIEAAAAAVAACGLPLVGLVNNAGIALGGPLEFLPIEQLRQQFEVNVFGAVAVAQAFLPQLRAVRGRLVFVGSIAGRLTVPLIAPYSASKHALRALADGFRLELAPAGIAVTLIEPGSVKTPIWEKAAAGRAEFVHRLPLPAMTLYGQAIDALFDRLDAEARHGLGVERVSAAIVRALTAARPPDNDLVGFPARAGSIVALLPSRLRDRLLFGVRR